jgi:EAL and modified HD-GYP domain-containing signal transduction protein
MHERRFADTELRSAMEFNNRFIARQAILDVHSNCIGYELLYRDSNADRAIFEDASQASIQVFDSAYLFGIDALCGELKAFVNCTQQVLCSDFVKVLQPGRTVLEIQGASSPDASVIRSCERLKAEGYSLALDDYREDGDSDNLLPLLDVVKVDAHTVSAELAKSLRRRLGAGGKLLAQKVETREQYDVMRGFGFELFQGFYFCQPQVMATPALSPSRISSIRLLQATVNEQLSFDDLEAVIKQDASLCYRLLRYINSVEFFHRASVQSIRHALALLGERNTRRWAVLTGTVLAADDKPRELLRSALLRARLMEVIAPCARCSEYEGFLVGLLSLMTVILDSKLAVDQLEIPVTVRGALAGKEGRLRDLLNAVISYERGEWARCEQQAAVLRLREPELSAAYLQAATWVSRIPI